jgi:sulfur relay (sulfurtransferase) DsrC/TusE family protein
MSKHGPSFQRKTNIKPTRKRFLIICEGQQTEYNYFKSFQIIGRDTKTVHIDIVPLGAVGITVVKEAKKRKDQDGSYQQDEVWCVFDRDAKKENNNQKNFNEAIKLAMENKLNLAISNDAFELWYLLHYEYYESETHRSNIIKMLTKRLGEKFSKNDANMYEKIKDKQSQAIKNAKKLWLIYADLQFIDQNIKLSIEERMKRHNINPSTTVYELVEKLNELIFTQQ